MSEMTRRRVRTVWVDMIWSSNAEGVSKEGKGEGGRGNVE